MGSFSASYFLYRFFKREYIYKLYSVQFRYNFLNFLYRDNVKVFSDKKKALDHWDGQGFLVVAEAGFEPTPSCGTRKNLRAVRLLDFFDRCAIPCSLYHPPDAVAGDAFGTLRSLVSDKRKKP